MEERGELSFTAVVITQRLHSNIFCQDDFKQVDGTRIIPVVTSEFQYVGGEEGSCYQRAEEKCASRRDCKEVCSRLGGELAGQAECGGTMRWVSWARPARVTDPVVPVCELGLQCGSGPAGGASCWCGDPGRVCSRDAWCDTAGQRCVVACPAGQQTHNITGQTDLCKFSQNVKFPRQNCFGILSASLNHNVSMFTDPDCWCGTVDKRCGSGTRCTRGRCLPPCPASPASEACGCTTVICQKGQLCSDLPSNSGRCLTPCLQPSALPSWDNLNLTAPAGTLVVGTAYIFTCVKGTVLLGGTGAAVRKFRASCGRAGDWADLPGCGEHNYTLGSRGRNISGLRKLRLLDGKIPSLVES